MEAEVIQTEGALVAQCQRLRQRCTGSATWTSNQKTPGEDSRHQAGSVAHPLVNQTSSEAEQRLPRRTTKAAMAATAAKRLQSAAALSNASHSRCARPHESLGPGQRVANPTAATASAAALSSAGPPAKHAAPATGVWAPPPSGATKAPDRLLAAAAAPSGPAGAASRCTAGRGRLPGLRTFNGVGLGLGLTAGPAQRPGLALPLLLPPSRISACPEPQGSSNLAGTGRQGRMQDQMDLHAPTRPAPVQGPAVSDDPHRGVDPLGATLGQRSPPPLPAASRPVTVLLPPPPPGIARRPAGPRLAAAGAGCGGGADGRGRFRDGGGGSDGRHRDSVWEWGSGSSAVAGGGRRGRGSKCGTGGSGSGGSSYEDGGGELRDESSVGDGDRSGHESGYESSCSASSYSGGRSGYGTCSGAEDADDESDGYVKRRCVRRDAAEAAGAAAGWSAGGEEAEHACSGPGGGAVAPPSFREAASSPRSGGGGKWEPGYGPPWPLIARESRPGELQLSIRAARTLWPTLMEAAKTESQRVTLLVEAPAAAAGGGGGDGASESAAAGIAGGCRACASAVTPVCAKLRNCCGAGTRIRLPPDAWPLMPGVPADTLLMITPYAGGGGALVQVANRRVRSHYHGRGGKLLCPGMEQQTLAPLAAPLPVAAADTDTGGRNGDGDGRAEVLRLRLGLRLFDKRSFDVGIKSAERMFSHLLVGVGVVAGDVGGQGHVEAGGGDGGASVSGGGGGAVCIDGAAAAVAAGAGGGSEGAEDAIHYGTGGGRGGDGAAAAAGEGGGGNVGAAAAGGLLPIQSRNITVIAECWPQTRFQVELRYRFPRLYGITSCLQPPYATLSANLASPLMLCGAQPGDVVELWRRPGGSEDEFLVRVTRPDMRELRAAIRSGATRGSRGGGGSGGGGGNLGAWLPLKRQRGNRGGSGAVAATRQQQQAG